MFTRSIPTSQCIVCHIHPGTNMVATYLGYTWWDNETDGDKMYPAQQHNPSRRRALPVLAGESGSRRRARKVAGYVDSFRKVGSPAFNAQLKHTQFADFHGHGWVFRAVYKRDRKGNLLDAEDQHGPPTAIQKNSRRPSTCRTFTSKKACIARTAISQQDSHGNGKIYGETRNAVEIDCMDCHGTIAKKATLRTSAAAAPEGGNDLSMLRTPFGQRRFYWQNGKLYQRFE